MFSDFWNANNEWIISLFKTIMLSVLTLGVSYFIIKGVKACIKKLGEKHPTIDVSLFKIFSKVVTVVLWLIAALIVLDLFGVNTASVLTILGASALAVGLALKDTLSNIAAGIFLLSQHPYKTGDYIDCAGSVSGTIVEIGLFTSRLKTPQGQEIFVPNNSILNAPIVNYSSNALRRADLAVQISYADDIEKAKACLLEMLNSYDIVEKDPMPTVLVKSYGDSGIELNIRFWAKNEAYWDAYFKANSEIKSRFNDNGITIPYPQRVITMSRSDS